MRTMSVFVTANYVVLFIKEVLHLVKHQGVLLV